MNSGNGSRRRISRAKARDNPFGGPVESRLLLWRSLKGESWFYLYLRHDDAEKQGGVTNQREISLHGQFSRVGPARDRSTRSDASVPNSDRTNRLGDSRMKVVAKLWRDRRILRLGVK
jgi:hypothetical protein